MSLSRGVVQRIAPAIRSSGMQRATLISGPPRYRISIQVYLKAKDLYFHVYRKSTTSAYCALVNRSPEAFGEGEEHEDHVIKLCE